MRISRTLIQVELGSCCFFTAVCVGFSQSAYGCIFLVDLCGLKYMIPGPHRFCTKWQKKKKSEKLAEIYATFAFIGKYSNCSWNSWGTVLGFCIKMSFFIWEGWSKLYLRFLAEGLQQRRSSIARGQMLFFLLDLC